MLLSLSAKRPHKNLLALIGALARIPAQRRPLLVLPGYATWHEAELRARAASLGVAGDVRFEGWLAAAELEGLWALADAFVFPSLYEGFGLPVLEAMARGVPVACADASSLPEVAGDAALLFDPHAESEIAAAIERLLGDAALAAQLRAKGLARARQFTWERTAQLDARKLRARAGAARGAAVVDGRIRRQRRVGAAAPSVPAGRRRSPPRRARSWRAPSAASSPATGAAAFSANQSAVRSRRARPASWTRTIASAIGRGVGGGRDEAVARPPRRARRRRCRRRRARRWGWRARRPRRRPCRSPRGWRSRACTARASARRRRRRRRRSRARWRRPGGRARRSPAASAARSGPSP